MTREIMPGQRTGEIRIPASKSVSHRMLILAALGEKDVTLKLNGVSSDIQATAECLAALGAGISEAEGKIEVSPIKESPSGARVLRCRDSGEPWERRPSLSGKGGSRRGLSSPSAKNSSPTG